MGIQMVTTLVITLLKMIMPMITTILVEIVYPFSLILLLKYQIQANGTLRIRFDAKFEGTKENKNASTDFLKQARCAYGICKDAQKFIILQTIINGVVGDDGVILRGKIFNTFIEFEGFKIEKYAPEDPVDIRLSNFLKCCQNDNELVTEFDKRQIEMYIHFLESAQKNLEVSSIRTFADLANILYRNLFTENGKQIYAKTLRTSLRNEKCTRQTFVSIAKQEEVRYKVNRPTSGTSTSKSNTPNIFINRSK